MILSKLIRKGGLTEIATATHATAATLNKMRAVTVAKVATVAVADTPILTMTHAEEAAIRRWLEYINETDAEIITDVISRCRGDTVTRLYFLERTNEIPDGYT